jgi:hypothetical protein
MGLSIGGFGEGFGCVVMGLWLGHDCTLVGKGCAVVPFSG